jgi:hypothetical protein
VIKMKKLVLILAVLIATPALALQIDLYAHAGGVVDVNYSGADPCNPPRAFALDVTVTGDATVSLSGGYKTDGESTDSSRGYGIYPARILIDSNGDPISYGNPEADPCDPGANKSPSHLVLEFGSLYVGDNNAPVVEGVTEGRLCQLTVVCGSLDANLVVTAETTYRGGVLLEDGTDVSGSASAEIQVCAIADPNAGTCWDRANECGGQDEGDANCDGNVNFIDLGLLKAAIFSTQGDGSGRYNCCADFNQDFGCNFIDLGIMKAHIFQTGKTPATLNTTCPAHAQP